MTAIPLFDIFYLLTFLNLCSNFKNIILLYLIIFVHELGHIFFIKLFNKELISIKFYSFGGLSKYITKVNHNILEELLIAIGGILNQLILFIIFKVLYKYSLINSYTYNLFINNNISLIIFNLMPMIGLDGEKIIHLLLEYFIPFVIVNKIMIIISLISLIIFVIISFNYKINIIFIIVFIIYNLIKYIKDIKYINNKFYLERYLYDIPYNDIKYINSDNLKYMYQQKYHFFNHIKEYEYLKKKYN